MDQFFRIALCACLCLGGLQATPVRSKRAEQQCTIDKESLILSELDKVLCVSRRANDYDETRLWVVGFFNFLFRAGVAKNQKNIERPKMNFSLRLQQNVALSSPTNVTVRGSVRRTK